MMKIPGGTFMMGTDEAEIERLCKKFNRDWIKRESPQHLVTIQPFFMSKYPITQEQWKAIASQNALKVNNDLDPDTSRFKGNKNPVEQVSWYDCVEFSQRLSKLIRQDNKIPREYQLPSEAQWEYGCRAATTTPFYFGETITTGLANYNGNFVYAEENKGKYRKKTTPVGSFPPNGFGLYDMHGNVWEWCKDHWQENYQGAPEDGSAWLSGDSSKKVIRGGSWNDIPAYCRSAFRFFNPRAYRVYSFGLRVVCVVPRTT